MGWGTVTGGGGFLIMSISTTLWSGGGRTGTCNKPYATVACAANATKKASRSVRRTVCQIW